MQSPQTPICSLFEPGEVVYMPGWDYCYQIISGPFCRINFVRWRGQIASTSSDAKTHISYLIRVLGGKTVSRILIKASNFPVDFG